MRFTTNQPFFPKNGIVSENLNFTLDFQSVEVNGKYQIVKQGGSNNESYISNHHSKITINGGAIKDSKEFTTLLTLMGNTSNIREKKSSDSIYLLQNLLRKEVEDKCSILLF
jgi:hypothetical protein